MPEKIQNATSGQKQMTVMEQLSTARKRYERGLKVLMGLEDPNWRKTGKKKGKKK
jgi:hypothetical protein